jgi:DUF971 family protein
MKPVVIKIIGAKKLFIKWDDKTESIIPLQKLRRFCPCATCQSFREMQSKNYISLFYNDQIYIESISEVGNYAISIIWKDGHSTGIYEFSYLKNLANN